MGCCEGDTASCLACKSGITVEKYCDMVPRDEGCPDFVVDLPEQGPDSGIEPRLLQEEQPCCEAETASCLACKSGTTVDEYCDKVPRIEGCPDFVVDLPEQGPDSGIKPRLLQEERPCCEAETASCLACKSGTTVDEYC